MHLPGFENAYFLQSVGWAIANSFWQIGILWSIYHLITMVDKNMSPLVKHHFSVSLMGLAMVWFWLTIILNYQALTNNNQYTLTLFANSWRLKFASLGNSLPYLSIFYFLLLCFFALQFFNRLLSNHFLQNNGLIKAPVDLRLFTTHTSLHLGIKRKVQVWISEHIDVPSVTGFLKPVILLPAAIINQLTVKQVEAILLHELAHIKRNDYLINLFQSIIELMLFYNPFILLLGKIARKERENCCDDWVLNYQYDQHDYAHALLILEEQRYSKLSFALAATNGKKNLLNRIKRLFKTSPQTNFTNWQQFKLTGLCLVLMVIMVGILPLIKNKDVTVNKLITISDPEKIGMYQTNSYAEKADEQSFINQPALPISQTQEIVKQPPPTKRSKKEPEASYVNAFINEELFDPTTIEEPVASLASEIESDEIKYYVEVEEQQSGKKQTNVYFFELKNEKGTTVVKPLIILNKLKISTKIKTDSITTKPAKKRVRVTS